MKNEFGIFLTGNFPSERISGIKRRHKQIEWSKARLFTQIRIPCADNRSLDYYNNELNKHNSQINTTLSIIQPSKQLRENVLIRAQCVPQKIHALLLFAVRMSDFDSWEEFLFLSMWRHPLSCCCMHVSPQKCTRKSSGDNSMKKWKQTQR